MLGPCSGLPKCCRASSSPPCLLDSPPPLHTPRPHTLPAHSPHTRRHTPCTHLAHSPSAEHSLHTPAHNPPPEAGIRGVVFTRGDPGTTRVKQLSRAHTSDTMHIWVLGPVSAQCPLSHSAALPGLGNCPVPPPLRTKQGAWLTAGCLLLSHCTLPAFSGGGLWDRWGERHKHRLLGSQLSDYSPWHTHDLELSNVSFPTPATSLGQREGNL